MEILKPVACKKCQIMGKRKKEKDRIECRGLNIDLEMLEFQRFSSVIKY